MPASLFQTLAQRLFVLLHLLLALRHNLLSHLGIRLAEHTSQLSQAAPTRTAASMAARGLATGRIPMVVAVVALREAVVASWGI